MIVVYDVTSGESFVNVKRWLQEIDQNCDTVNRILGQLRSQHDDIDNVLLMCSCSNTNEEWIKPLCAAFFSGPLSVSCSQAASFLT